jgi:hypothetical protein
MKRLLVLSAILLGGVVIGLMIGLLLSTEQRVRISRQIVGACGQMEERMPEG